MVRIKEKRIEAGLTQPELAKEIGKDVPLISKFENFVCVPVPEDAVKIAKALKCSTLLDLYDETDLTFLNTVTKKSKKRAVEELLVYRLTADLPREATNWLTKSNLSMLGFSSIKDWINDCYGKLKKRIKKKKSHLDSNQNDSANSKHSKTIHCNYNKKNLKSKGV